MHKTESSRKMNGTEIVKYFNIVLLSKKDDKFFSVCQCSVPKHLKCETVTEKKYFNNYPSKLPIFQQEEIILNSLKMAHLN